MAQFFKFLFASCLGVLLALAVVFGIGSLLAISFAAQANKPAKVKPNTVLHLTFDQPIPELTNNIPADPFATDFSNPDILGLHDMAAAIEQAAQDDDIKGIFLEPGLNYTEGFATTRTLRNALHTFRDSGKFIIAHSKFFFLSNYYLTAAGTEVHVNPAGVMEVRSLSSQVSFFGDMFDRIDLDAQVFYAGKFKSATEPLRRRSMSEEYRLQVREYLQDNYQVLLDDISADRNLDRDELRSILDQHLAGSPEDALRLKLVDGVSYVSDLKDRMRELIGLSEDDNIPMMSLGSYYRSNPPERNFRVRDKIAVIYAEGNILDGKASNGSIGDQTYVKTIGKIANDDRVQAVVLRVNSGGGSALASENIWYALKRMKDAGKPLVVSMGDLAASGGYYISCLADSIYAQPNTLTGSIGVFRILPNFSGTMKQELGIDFDSVRLSDRAVGYSPFFDLTEAEKEYVQQETDRAYELFLERVAEGRNMPRDAVHAVAQGRVWTGSKAVEKGLVDALGGLDQAIATAANLADLEEYRTVDYPEVKDPFTQLVEELFNANPQARTRWLIERELPHVAPYYDQWQHLKNSEGIQARLPFVPTWL